MNRVPAPLVTRCETIIDASGLAPELEAALTTMQARPGRPRELSVRALLVGMLLTAMTGKLHQTRIVQVLNEMGAPAKKRLGLQREGGITRRQVQRLFQDLAEVTKAQGTDGLDAFSDALLDATFPAEARESYSIAVDGTGLESWAKKRSSKSKVASRPDPDARWRPASGTWKKHVYGYELTAAVTVPEVGGDDVPLVAIRIRLRPAVKDSIEMGLAVVASTGMARGRLGDVVVDRGYTRANDGANFLMPVRALGGEPVFDLYQDQLGVSGTSRGALVVDGAPYSPALPKRLRLLEPPAFYKPRAEREAYEAAVKARAVYAMKPRGRTRDNGSQDYICPAQAGQLRCPLVASSQALGVRVLPALAAPKRVGGRQVCSKKHTRFDASDLPLRQRHLYGSEEWYSSYARRNRVEGFFGNLKNDATESLQRGSIRVMGLFKTGLMVAMSVAATNLRLIETFRARAAQSKKKPARRGRPRKPGVQVFTSLALAHVRVNSPPGIEVA